MNWWGTIIHLLFVALNSYLVDFGWFVFLPLVWPIGLLSRRSCSSFLHLLLQLHQKYVGRNWQQIIARWNFIPREVPGFSWTIGKSYSLSSLTSFYRIKFTTWFLHAFSLYYMLLIIDYTLLIIALYLILLFHWFDH